MAIKSKAELEKKYKELKKSRKKESSMIKSPAQCFMVSTTWVRPKTAMREKALARI